MRYLRIHCLDEAFRERHTEVLESEEGPSRWDPKIGDLELSPITHKLKHELELGLHVDGRMSVTATRGFTLKPHDFAFGLRASSVVVKGCTVFSYKIKGVQVTVLYCAISHTSIWPVDALNVKNKGCLLE